MFPALTPHKCWFCDQANPSYLPICEYCKGVPMPTRDKSRKEIKWTVFSFGSSAPASDRRPFSHFFDAMEVFDMQNRIAIQLDNGKTNVREKGKKEAKTKYWDDEDRMSLFRAQGLKGSQSNMPSASSNKAPRRTRNSTPPYGKENPALAVRIEILTWLLKGIERFDKDFTLEDSKKLRQPIRYLYYSLISASKNEADSWETGASAYFIDFYIHLGKEIKKLEERFDKDITDFGDLTSMAMLELIARIIAQKHNCSLSINEYMEAFKGLDVLEQLRQYKDSDNGNTSPYHAIATTREKWPSLGNIERLAIESRRERLQNPKNIEHRTKTVWRDIHSRYNTLAAKAKETERATKSENLDGWMTVVRKGIRESKKDKSTEEEMKNRISEARKLPATYRNPTQPLHCSGDQAAAIVFPDCAILARFFKCQRLYNYTMHPTAKADESSEKCFRNPTNFVDGR
ncbi:hypothetical protein B7494_g972 [Chlorociboria aeruginascens]|nr:hypothetical protein B7494_g972 [Chlorociboria aeruginascens]